MRNFIPSISLVYKPLFHGTLGISRRDVTSFFKDPARANVFQQVRRVNTFDTRFYFFLNSTGSLFGFLCTELKLSLSHRFRNRSLGFLILLAASGKKVQVNIMQGILWD